MTMNGIEYTVPVVPDIHARVYEIVTTWGTLEYRRYHTSETCKCWAGWLVTVAGDDGRDLERRAGTLNAALMLAAASGSPVLPEQFILDNETMLSEIQRRSR